MKVTERFLHYVSFDTQSADDVETVPSTEKQRALAEDLAAEMKKIGIENVTIDEHSYVMGEIPSNLGTGGAACAAGSANAAGAAGSANAAGAAGSGTAAGAPSLGFVSHMDTSPDASGADIKPRIVHYEGGPIELSEGMTLDPEEYPALSGFIGQDVIVTDGKTLLGADDKAGIAEIMTMAERLINDDTIKHGRIAIAFTPDEEVGNGTACFDVKKFGADFAYTVDGGTLGELEYENFNGASAKITVHGREIHPGDAKGVMKNALQIACEFNAFLPRQQRPEYTEGHEGFYLLHRMEGTVSEAHIEYIVREHDREKFEAMKDLMRKAVEYINLEYGDVLDLDLRDSYYNMKEMILPHMELIDRAKQAFSDCGVKPEVVPIRGGTDGAALSYKGVPCPNLSTGGQNFHSVREYISVQAMEKMTDVLVELVKLTYRP